MVAISTRQREPRSDATFATGTLSRGLGWFSVALGLTELAAPRPIANTIGVEPDGTTPFLLRAMGARELLAGLGVLLRPRQPRALWSRVVGDAIDLALLGVAVKSKRFNGARFAGALAAVAGVGALDVIAALRTQRAYAQANRPAIFSVAINRPAEEIYTFFRRFSQLPRVMDYLHSVREADAQFSHWVARLPAGGTIAWDTKITEDRPGEAIAWRSVEGSRISTQGRVTFTPAPGVNMTEVRLEMQLGFVGNKASTSVAPFFTRAQIREDLVHLKQVLETGEAV